MEPEVIAAFIALAGVVLSVGISLIIALLSTRYNYRQLYAETVSKNRMEWINVWRQNISLFLTDAELLHENNRSEEKNCELEKEMLQARSMITIRLNLSEEDHQKLFHAIKTFDYRVDEKQFILKREEIENLARTILKPEWERVKQEAQGKSRNKED